ncbi:MAG TPA: hypothetical protein VD793_10470, partial [Gemmatimonadales bacterium]|nr:hypothetical protein [Gemmatimonadales bacterium]
QARRAFENIDFEQAARLFTRVLDVAAGATAAERDTAQLYLGVSYEYAGQRVNAVSAFRALVRSSPCAATPEQFGAGVTAAYVEAQGGIFAVGPCDLERQEATPESGAVFRVAATRPALLRVLLLDSAGRTAADFGEVAAAGVAQRRWPNLPDATALPVGRARYQLLFRARAAQGTESDERSFPVEVVVPAADTVGHPPAPAPGDYRPEQRSVGPAVGDFGKALAVGGAAVAASVLLAPSSLGGETGKAVMVGGAITFAGFVAFVKGSGERDLSENRQFNAQLLRAWEVRRDSVSAVNRGLLRNRPIIIEPVGGR